MQQNAHTDTVILIYSVNTQRIRDIATSVSTQPDITTYRHLQVMLRTTAATPDLPHSYKRG